MVEGRKLAIDKTPAQGGIFQLEGAARETTASRQEKPAPTPQAVRSGYVWQAFALELPSSRFPRQVALAAQLAAPVLLSYIRL